jgi:hypothetical protein
VKMQVERSVYDLELMGIAESIRGGRCMNRKTLAALVFISLVVSGCALLREGYVKPGLDIRDEKVGLEVINYVRPGSIGGRARIVSAVITEPIEKSLLSEIRMNTQYRIETISGIGSYASGFVDSTALEVLTSQLEYKDAIRRIGKHHDLDYIITVYVCNVEVTVGDQVYFELLTQIAETESAEIVFEDTGKRHVEPRMLEKVVSRFPGYITTESGHNLAEDFRWLNTLIFNAPGQSDYPDASAIFLVDEIDVKANIKPGSIFTALTKYGNIYTITTRHVAIKILNERGYVYADMQIPFSPGTHIENIEARTIKRDGTVVHLADDQIHEVTLFPEYIFFSDVKAKKFTMPAVEPGCIVEYMYTVVSESVAMWGSWEFQRVEPVLLSKFSLDIPRGMEYSKKFLCTDNAPDRFKKLRESVDDWEKQGAYRKSRFSDEVRTTKQYILRDIPPLVLEENMPSWNNLVARLNYFSATFGGEPYLTKWTDIGNWYADLVSSSLEPDASIRQKAGEITRNKGTFEEKVCAIYHYIQENFRYVAVELGIGKIVPQSPKEVERDRYGDCKGLSALMIAMLRSIGADAYPAILRAKSAGDLDEAYIAFSQFDHMIVCVENEGQKMWLDPSVRSCAFLSLPWQDQGVKALVIKPDNSHFATTPTSEAEDNLAKTEWDIKLHPDGRLTCQVKRLLKEQGGLSFREALGQLSENEQHDWISQNVAQTFSQAQLVSYQVGNLKEMDAPLTFSYEFEAPNVLQKAGDLLLFPLPLRTGVTTFTQKKRVHPIIFDYPFHQVDEMKIHLPDGYTVEELPEPVDLETQFGRLRSSLTKQQNTIIYRQDIIWNATRIPAFQYEDLCQLQRDFASAQYNNMVLRKSGI